jgi:copper chaperone NosL
MKRMLSVVALTVAAMACAQATPQPAELDTRNDACARCRMAVSDGRFAGQIVAPGHEPRFYDDLGCLRKELASSPLPRGAAVFVADHRTGEWVVAERAVYTFQPALATPMASHLVAHADRASRDADPDVAGGEERTPGALGFAGPAETVAR